MDNNTPKNSVTFPAKKDYKVWDLMRAKFAEPWDAKQIGYIGMESRKTYVFKDRAVMERFVKELAIIKVPYSVDNMFPKDVPGL